VLIKWLHALILQIEELYPIAPIRASKEESHREISMKRTVENYWVTPEEIIKHGPCSRWPDERVYAWFGKRKKSRLSTIIQDERIPAVDRMWIITDVIYLRSDISIGWWPAKLAASNLHKIIQAIE